MILILIFTFMIFHSNTALGITLNADVLKQETNDYNYYSGSPATFSSVCKGATCFSSHSGFSDIHHKNRVDSRTLIRIGSNSKFITASLILTMVDQGYLGLDDSLEVFFPEVSHWKKVTIRHLLGHTSGIPGYLFSDSGSKRFALSLLNWRTRHWHVDDVVKMFRDKPLEFEPDSRMVYNNSNYFLLGIIAEKAGGQDLETLLNQKVFEPLHMKNTYSTISNGNQERLANGYSSSPFGFNVPDWLFNFLVKKVDKHGRFLNFDNAYHPSLVWSAGGFISNTEDLGLLAQGVFTGKLFSQNLLNQMMKTRVGSAFDFPVIYGLGAMSIKTPYGRAYGHTGLIPGFETVNYYFPDHDISLIASQNVGPSQVYSVFLGLLDQVFEGHTPSELDTSVAPTIHKLEPNQVHFRFKGVMKIRAHGGLPYRNSVGFAINHGASIDQPLYQKFQVDKVRVDKQTYLRLQGLEYLSFDLKSPLPVNGDNRFMEIFVDEKSLRAHASDPEGVEIHVFSGWNTEADGLCIGEILDPNKTSQYDIEYQVQDRRHPTIRFVGNLHLTQDVQEANMKKFYKTAKPCNAAAEKPSSQIPLKR